MIGPFCAKCTTIDLKKVERSYISWHWRVMQNSKKKWLVVWKMTWGIWQIFIWTLESVKIGIFMGSFYPKQKMHDLQSYRGVISNGTEEWWKIRRELTCCLKIGIRNLTNFDLRTQSVKVLLFNGLLLTKAYNVLA